MSQHDYAIADQAGLSFLSDLNSALGAVVSLNSGATAPATTFPYMLWADTTSGWLKQRNSADTAWELRLPLACARDDVASASTLDLDAQTSHYLRITGTTTVTAVTLADGQMRAAVAADAFTLTNGASLVVPGGTNYTTTAGDMILFYGEAAGVVRVAILKGDGTPVVGNGYPKVNDFRLTLTTGTPVTTADVTGATTIYCTPYKGNQIALYTGSAWVVRESAEFSKVLGTLTSGKPYDVFCYDNAGTPTLEFLVWTNDTTRATALAYQDGVLVKSGAATRRYLGTFYTTSSTATEDSAAKRYLWNYYNRVAKPMGAFETTNTWTYTTNTIRQANNSTANQLNFVLGVGEDAVKAICTAGRSNSVGSMNTATYIGLDSTTAPSSDATGALIGTGAANVIATVFYSGTPSAGKHYLAWLEWSVATGTTTWVGDNGLAQNCSGISGEVMA